MYVHSPAPKGACQDREKFQANAPFRCKFLTRPEQFTSKAFGEPKRRPGDKWAFWYFLPATMPRMLDLDNETVYALPEATAWAQPVVVDDGPDRPA